VRIKVKFYAVPDETMGYKVLLSRDFLSCPSLRVTLGDVVKIENADEANIKQVLNVVDTDHPISVRDTLQINPKIDRNMSDTDTLRDI